MESIKACISTRSTKRKAEIVIENNKKKTTTTTAANETDKMVTE